MALFAKQRLFRTEDGRIVAEDDPAAAFLFAAEGDEIADEEAARHGLTAKSKLVSATAEEKEAPPPADKQAGPPANKARGR